MAYTTQYDVAYPSNTKGDFEKKVHMSMIKTASAVVGESQGSLTGTNHKKRHDLGVQIIRSPADWIQVFLDAVAATTEYDGETSDTNIDNQVSALFSDVAGVGNLS